MVNARGDHRIAWLRNVWLFSQCSDRELRALARIATPSEVEAGHVLAREGAVGDQFFVVVTGRASVTRGSKEIGVVGTGSFFGEMALLDHAGRVATVTAIEPMTLLAMTRVEFDDLIERAIPSVARKMLTVFGERLRSVDLRIASTERGGVETVPSTL